MPKPKIIATTSRINISEPPNSFMVFTELIKNLELKIKKWGILTFKF